MRAGIRHKLLNGAWLRWGFGLWLGGASSRLNLGTLAANLVGGYLVGLAVAFVFTLTPERLLGRWLWQAL